MNIRKMAFFITSAAILISAMAEEASARTVNESNNTQLSSIASVETRPSQVGEQASFKSRALPQGGRLAFNPQPDPPGAHHGFGQ
jgi:hypothetical protein